MRLKLPLFVDARYNAEQDVEFDAENVQNVDETMRSLFLGGNHKITQVTLRDGRQYTLSGHLKMQIERAQKS